MQWLYGAFVLALFAIFIGFATQKRRFVHDDAGNHIKNIYSKALAFLYMLPLIFVSAFRHSFIDTNDYRYMYEVIGTNWNNVFNGKVPDVEKGYLFFTYILNLISKDSQLLIIVTTIIITICFVKFICLEAYDISFSLLLYLCQYWVDTMNGVRQILVAAIVCMVWKKWSQCSGMINNVLFIVTLIALSSFHKSILICIPVFLVARGELLNKGIVLCVLSALAMVAVPSLYHLVFSFLLRSSEYSDYISESASMGGMRFIVSCVPFVLVWLYYSKIYRREAIKNQKMIWMMNISVFNFCCDLLALKMVYFARIGLYFEVFNFILIPYLIDKCFTKQSAKFMKIIATLMYIVFFCYQIQAYGGYASGFKLVL